MRTILFSILLAIIPSYLTIGSGIAKADSSSVLSPLPDEKRCMDAVESLKGAERESSLVEAMRRGHWECAKTIIGSSEKPPTIDYKSIIDKEMKAIVAQMESVKKSVSDLAPSKPSIHCPFKWAQSPTEILLSVKFSHKIDAPATLNVVAQNVSVTEDRLVLLASDGKKSFRLDINFMGEVVPADSTWSMASVGRMNFNIKKAGPPSKWAGLTKGNKKLWQMHNWFEMQDKFEAQLEELEELNAKAVPAPSDSEAAKVDTVVDPEEVVEGAAAEEVAAAEDPATSETTAVSADEIARKVEEKKAQDEHKKKLSALADEARMRKRTIDATAKQQKEAVDTEITARVEELERARDESPATTASDEL